jgi:hypothetical protein
LCESVRGTIGALARDGLTRQPTACWHHGSHDHGKEETTMAAKAKRTTLRSSAGKKLYAVRDASGKFKDIQSYKRAQGQDVKRTSKAEK